MDKTFRNEVLSRLHPEAQKASRLASIDREYSLYEIAIMTRAGAAKLVGLADRGHLGVGGAADITVYTDHADREKMFSKPDYVFKDGRMVVKDGDLIDLSPWNFPIVLASRKISTALAAGCSVICKPDIITPGSVMELMNIINDAGVPPGVVNLLSGDPPSISSQLISSDIIKKISITGSTRVGKLILKQAADKVQRVTMELSGHSPFIVFDDVDINKVTDMAITAKFRNNGQVCISPNRFYIHESKKDEFVNLFVAKATKLKIGNGINKDTIATIDY